MQSKEKIPTQLPTQFYKFLIKGTVQGVGFRPYIYRKAKQYNLFGTVKNTGNGVIVIVNDKDFLKKIERDADLPVLARITDWNVKKIKSIKTSFLKSKSRKQNSRKQNKNRPMFSDFKIIESDKNQKKKIQETTLPKDTFICDDCKKELKDNSNRRHNYYFITCTNCGPRFSMIKDYPYDRKNTSMNEFKMCGVCKNEYLDPSNRRYHAETIACKNCGPKLKLVVDGKIADVAAKTAAQNSDEKLIRKACSILADGEILAIKGNGGFHLCSLARKECVQKIRSVLGRPNKPFAIMVKDISMLKSLNIAQISEKEKELLKSQISPIVALKKKNQSILRHISELDTIGVMLPYTALHYLLFDFIDEPIVMTSCNFSGLPIIIDENDSQLKKITKNILFHKRKIVNRCDDSVLKVISENSNDVVFLRRSRGFVPEEIPINTQKENNTQKQNSKNSKKFNQKHIVALGAELNNAICVLKNNCAYLSQYIGETSKIETVDFLKETTGNFIRLTRLNPKAVVCDLHPSYNTTNYAYELAKKYNAKLIQIQHHKAHVASVAAEHNLSDYVGIAMDGLGYGDDGKIWGGEVFLVKQNINFQRIGSLEEQIQVGGDLAAVQPKRMLIGILAKFMSAEEIRKMNLFSDEETKLILNQIGNGFNTISTTSCGRILDAAAALLGICTQRTYDGRPAMLLESFAENTKPYDFEPRFKYENDRDILLTTPLFKFLIDGLKRKKDKKRLAATVQMYLAKGLFIIAKKTSHSNKNLRIVFSGGVAYNKMISSSMLNNGVLINAKVPCGDGGVSFGQAYLANLLIKNKHQN